MKSVVYGLQLGESAPEQATAERVMGTVEVHGPKRVTARPTKISLGEAIAFVAKRDAGILRRLGE